MITRQCKQRAKLHDLRWVAQGRLGCGEDPRVAKRSFCKTWSLGKVVLVGVIVPSAPCLGWRTRRSLLAEQGFLDRIDLHLTQIFSQYDEAPLLLHVASVHKVVKVQAPSYSIAMTHPAGQLIRIQCCHSSSCWRGLPLVRATMNRPLNVRASGFEPVH